ncbi:MAG: two-component regulator propeller domain-containing protein [Bacteroidota bacterium]
MTKQTQKRLTHLICSYCVLCCVVSSLFGQATFKSFSSDEGLSQATVRCIQQDYLGFIWIGTYEGLNKYNGNKFSIYYQDKEDSLSLAGNSINDIFEDAQQNLWISTDGGLCRLNRDLEQFIRVFPDKNNPHLVLSDLAEDRAKKLWIAGTDGALYKKEEDGFIAFPNPENTSNIIEFIILKNGLFWLSYANYQLFEFNPKTGDFRLLKNNPNQEILSFFEDEASRVWLGLNGRGIQIYDASKDHWHYIKHQANDVNSLPNDIVKDIAVDKKEQTLLLATNSGIAKLPLKDLQLGTPSFQSIQHDSGDAQSLGSNFTTQIYQDQEGNFWIGTIDAGLSIWDKNSRYFQHFYHRISDQESISSNVIWDFEEDEKGNLWIGTSNGLNYFNLKTQKAIPYINGNDQKALFPSNRVWQILKENTNRYWIGTNGAITEMSISNGKPSFQTHQPSQYSFGTVRQLLLDHQQQLWVGTGHGLYIFDKEKKQYQAFEYNENDSTSLSSDDIRGLYEDSQNRIWVATSNGLNLYQQASNTFLQFLYDPSDSTSISDHVVRNIKQDQDGQIWIGTSKGLNKYLVGSDGQVSFKAYTKKDGLPNEVIYATEIDEQGYIWMSTNAGLSRFDSKNEVFLNFHPHQGLQDREFNAAASLKTKDGHLLFGGINGFNYFKPQEIVLDTLAPTIIFTELRVNYEVVKPNSRHLSKHINVADQVTLDYAEDQMFYLEFAALDLVNANTHQFAYRLLPFEEEWKTVGQVNNASYTNISPGKYQFQVKSADLNGHWSNQVKEIDIYIKPMIWQRAWFRLLLMAAAIGLIQLVFFLRTRSLHRDQQRLERIVSSRTAKVRAQKKELEETLLTLKKTQSVLIESEKLASLGQLTAGIAHELNNPINFINSSAIALQHDFEEAQPLLKKISQLKTEISTDEIQQLVNLSEQTEFRELLLEMQHLINSIQGGSKRITKIVNGLKTFTHQAEQTFYLENIVSLIEEALLILGGKIKDKQLEIIKDILEKLEIECQGGKIIQVFVNILDNAIDAVEQNGRIHVQMKTQDKQVRISIQDNGKGMDEMTLRRIYDPFFTTKEVGKGTGLGLTVSHGIIKMHGGHIEVESSIGAETNFTILLPFQQENLLV